MQEELKDLFDRALDDEPVFPDSGIAQQAMTRGRSIRRRRRGLVIGGLTAAAGVAVMAVLNLTPAPAVPPLPASAAAALMAQTEPQCTWPVSQDATDVGIFLRPDVTESQRYALWNALRTDPLVRDVRFESRQQAYERFKALWHDSPEFVAAVDASQLPESFRLKLTPSPRYSAFAATYAGRPGVEDLIGGVCP